MQQHESYKHLIFLNQHKKEIVYNQLTGLFFEINANAKEVILRYEELSREDLNDLNELVFFMKKYQLVEADEVSMFHKLYPKISPYAIWNDEVITFPICGQYVIYHCTQEEARIFDECNGSIITEQLSQKLGVPMNTLLQVLKKWVDIENPLLKLFPDSFQPHNVTYFQASLGKVLLHDEEDVIDLQNYYQNIRNGFTQFEDIETTISYLLREPTQFLDNERYGKRFFKSLLGRFPMTSSKGIAILEVGGGLGDFAESSLEYILSELKPGFLKNYTICDISPELLSHQQAKCEKYSSMMNFIHGRGESLPFKNESFDVIVSNEVIADFLNVKYSAVQTQLDSPCYYQLQRVIKQYSLHDFEYCSPYLNLGAILFLEEVMRVLKFNGIAVITEFAEPDMKPTISQYIEDHKEVSIDFELLCKISREIGFDCQLLDLNEYLYLQNDQKILSLYSFEPLKKLLEYYGIQMKKVIYTNNSVQELKEQYHLRNLRYIESSDLLTFFKALILYKKN